ncbi:hypothetical protein Tco_0700669 [Tanacetum coccineum]
MSIGDLTTVSEKKQKGKVARACQADKHDKTVGLSLITRNRYLETKWTLTLHSRDEPVVGATSVDLPKKAEDMTEMLVGPAVDQMEAGGEGWVEDWLIKPIETNWANMYLRNEMSHERNDKHRPNNKSHVQNYDTPHVLWYGVRSRIVSIRLIYDLMLQPNSTFGVALEVVPVGSTEDQERSLRALQLPPSIYSISYASQGN